MASYIARRKFLATLGGAAAAWPLAARAQQRMMSLVGFLHSGAFSASAELMIGVRKGLAETGYVVGQNLAIEYRTAEGRYDRLPALVTDLLQQQVAVLVAGGGNAPAQAAKAATANIPIVFVTGSDPIRAGLVASLSRPGGKINGLWMVLGLWPRPRHVPRRRLRPKPRTRPWGALWLATILPMANKCLACLQH